MKLYVYGLVIALSFLTFTAIVPISKASTIQRYQSINFDLLGASQTKSPGTSNRYKNSRRNKSNNSASHNPSKILQNLQYKAAVLGSRAGKRPVKNSLLVSQEQQFALEALKGQVKSKTGVTVRFDPKSGTPSIIRLVGKAPSLASRGSVADIAKKSARAFLKTNKDLIRIEDPDEELKLIRQKQELNGKKHFYYQQVVNDIPVWGSDVIVHLRPDNGVYLFAGRYQPSISNLDTVPSISQGQAEDLVMRALNITWTEKTESKLVIYLDETATPFLTYKVDTSPSLDQRWTYFIDAHTGRVLHKLKNIHNTVVLGQGLDGNNTLRGFNAWSESGTFYMIDPTTPLDDPAHDPLNEIKPEGDTYIYDLRNATSSPFFYSTSTSQTTGWDPTAVSAMVNTKTVYDYFLSTHGRQSIDDSNQNLLIAIHYDNNFNNAFWNGTYMVYGDGDGLVFNSLANCLDVAAHEMSHGVIETSANLIYQNQSGALNESFSDIFGAMVDRDDWLIGEDCTLAPPGFLRSLQDPSQGIAAQPSTYSEYQNLPNTEAGDNGGVHINSGIPNRAAYLIAEGLTMEALGTSIGKGKMEQIFYRALTLYLTASSQFIDARRATIQAADDLHGAGSAESLAVAAGWDAVEVIEGSQTTPSDPNPTPTNPVSGSDVMVYFYPIDGTRDFNLSDLYAVYFQELTDPPVYNPSLDTDLLNTVSAIDLVRPVIYTDGIGTWVYYVGIDSNVYEISVQTGNVIQITNTGTIWSIAIAEDGRYLTYTTNDLTDNNIYVIDLANLTVNNYPIELPDYTEGNNQTLNTAIYADAMSFDYTGNTIVFDFLNCVSTEVSDCNTGGGYRHWSIGLMDVATGQMNFPFSNQNPAFDLGYPRFAYNNNFVIALDFADYSIPGTVFSEVLTINFSTQEIASVTDFGAAAAPVFGVPSFWGDDNHITVQFPTGDATGTNAQRIALGSNGDGAWEGTNGLMEELNGLAVAMPTMHRVGQRTLTGALEADKSSIDFGDVLLNTQSQTSLTISNNGNSDVNITNISVAGIGFSHNGSNILLPRQSSVSLQVTFDAGASSGTRLGTLTYSTSDDPVALAISLIGNSVTPTGGGSNTSSPFGGDGGSGSYSPLLFLFFFFVLMFRHAKVRFKAYSSSDSSS